jgi:hypothetical protein
MKRLTRKQIEARLADTYAMARRNSRWKPANAIEQETKDALRVLSTQAVNALRKRLVLVSIRGERKRRKIKHTMRAKKAAA